MPISLRSFRVDDALWWRAMNRASEEGTSLSAVIREWLEKYANDGEDREPRIGLDDDGTLDEFFTSGVKCVHFEAIDQSRWYATVTLKNGDLWQLDFGAQNEKAKGYARAELVDYNFGR